MANANRNVIWTQTLLRFLSFMVQTAIHIANNSVFHERGKLIEVDYHFVREQIMSSVIQPCYAPTTEQPADIFTKAFASGNFIF